MKGPSENNAAADCGAADPADPIRRLYARLALHPEADFGWGKGKANALRLGYDAALSDRIPEAVWESSAAVGNPFSLGPIRPGETLLDVGCGAGTDLCFAATILGGSGRLLGIDLTPEMVDKARANLVRVGASHAEIVCGDFRKLPWPSASVDVVLSNGAINLAVKQEAVFREIARVLKPAGRLHLADMIRHDADDSVDVQGRCDADAWANCVAGTLAKDCLLKLIRDAGLVDVEFVGFTGYKTSARTEGGLIRAVKPPVDPFS